MNECSFKPNLLGVSGRRSTSPPSCKDASSKQSPSMRNFKEFHADLVTKHLDSRLARQKEAELKKVELEIAEKDKYERE